MFEDFVSEHSSSAKVTDEPSSREDPMISSEMVSRDDIT